MLQRPATRRPASAAVMEGDRSARARFTLAGLAVLLFVTGIFGLVLGAADLPAWRVILTWVGLDDGAGLKATDYLIMESIRLPRIIMAILIGGGLAVSGALMQGLFRNPLADPGIVGVSSGASLGAVSSIVLNGGLLAFAGIYALPFSAFLGGLLTTWLLYRIATRNGRTSIATLLLAGIAIGAFAAAATGLLIFMADDAQLRDITFWSLGSLAGATWSKIAATAPIILIA